MSSTNNPGKEKGGSQTEGAEEETRAIETSEEEANRSRTKVPDP